MNLNFQQTKPASLSQNFHVIKEAEFQKKSEFKKTLIWKLTST